MLGLYVETKNEYTTHLINILTPLIFEGLQSIYNDAQKISSSNDVLKIFQDFLRKVPGWNQNTINIEANRIVSSTTSYEWLNNLIKATVKSHIIILMYNPTIKIQNKIDSNYYQNIKISDFIHMIYIECAREFWNNPYLLFHEYPPIEIKRNQRDSMNIIKDCIKEAIRKLLPVKHILQIYLGEELENNINDNDFNKTITETEQRNITKLVNKDLQDNIDLQRNINKLVNKDLQDDITKLVNKDLQDNITKLCDEDEKNNFDLQKIKNDNTLIHQELTCVNSECSVKQNVINDINISDKTIRSKILNIINEHSDITSEDLVNLTQNKNILISSETSDLGDIKVNNKNKKKSDSEKNINKKKIYNSEKNDPNSFDNKIKMILSKDLASDSDYETSINYSQNNGNYQEIFSNSNISNKKMFNNYLQF